MLQINQEIAGESLRALQSFAQGLPQAQCNVLMSLLNNLGRNLTLMPPPAPPQASDADASSAQTEDTRPVA